MGTISFSQYVKESTECALKSDYYDPLGNSSLATYNKSFIQSVNYNTKCLYSEIKTIVSRPVLEVNVGDILSLLLIIPLFPVFTLYLTYHSKVLAEKELKYNWEIKRGETL